MIPTFSNCVLISFTVVSQLYHSLNKVKKFAQSRCTLEICSMLTIKTPERRHRRRSSVLIVNFEYILQRFLLFLLLTLEK